MSSAIFTKGFSPTDTHEGSLWHKSWTGPVAAYILVYFRITFGYLPLYTWHQTPEERCCYRRLPHKTATPNATPECQTVYKSFVPSSRLYQYIQHIVGAGPEFYLDHTFENIIDLLHDWFALLVLLLLLLLICCCCCCYCCCGCCCCCCCCCCCSCCCCCFAAAVAAAAVAAAAVAVAVAAAATFSFW